MAQASMGLQLGGAATSAVGSFYSARNQRDNLKSQADLAEINARIAELGAESALNQGKQQVANLTLQAGRLKSSQRAAMAANGIDLGTGTAVEIQASTDLMKEIDADTARSNALRSAWGYRTQAANQRNTADMARASARSISPFGSAATSLLGSASSVASSWYMLYKAGAFSDNTPAFGRAPAGSSVDPTYGVW
jgi:hypothetical protein